MREKFDDLRDNADGVQWASCGGAPACTVEILIMYNDGEGGSSCAMKFIHFYICAIFVIL